MSLYFGSNITLVCLHYLFNAQLLTMATQDKTTVVPHTDSDSNSPPCDLQCCHILCVSLPALCFYIVHYQHWDRGFQLGSQVYVSSLSLTGT